MACWNRRATDPYGRWCGGRELESPAYPIRCRSLAREPSHSKLRIAVVMSDNPDPDICLLNVVKKMVREAMKVASSEAAGIEVEALWILNCVADSNLKLRKEVVPKIIRDLIIPRQDFIEIGLDPPVKSNFHGL